MMEVKQYINVIAEIMKRFEYERVNSTTIIVDGSHQNFDKLPPYTAKKFTIETSDNGSTWFIPGWVNKYCDMPLETLLAGIAQVYVPVDTSEIEGQQTI